MTSASLCGACHEVHGPGLFDERTLSELRANGGEDSCLGCHESRGHRFAGVAPAWGEGPPERALAVASARALWARALELTLSIDGRAVTPTLSNPGRHAVPTGVSVIRDAWVDLEADGARLPRVLDLRATLTARGVPVALVTDAVNVGEGALAPGASRTFTWVRPEAPTGPVEVRAVLRAAAVRADTLEALGLEARRAEVVTHEVATATLRLGP